MATDLTPKQSTTACPQCEQHLEEFARLRVELTVLHGERGRRHSAGWWCRAGLGVLLLTTLPHIPRIGCYIREQADPDIAWGWLALWGLSIGLHWAQWSLIGIFYMLHEGPLWQRSLMYVGLSSIATTGTFLVVVLVPSNDHEMLYLAYAGPILAVVMAIPVFLARAFRRWTLAHRSSKADARPMSLASYLTVMTVLGVALTAMKLFPWREIATDLDGAVDYLLVFCGPLIAIGCLHLWLLPKMLGPRRGRSMSWKQWLLLGLIVSVGFLSSIGGFAARLSYARNFNWDLVAQVSALPLALITATTIFTAAGYDWLRMLDYELRIA